MSTSPAGVQTRSSCLRLGRSASAALPACAHVTRCTDSPYGDGILRVVIQVAIAIDEGELKRVVAVSALVRFDTRLVTPVA